MDKTPRFINPCPIIEVILELRFTSKIPTDAIMGIFYKGIQEKFSSVSVEHLPVSSFPFEVRNNPKFVYSPYYRFTIENNIVLLGPRIIGFTQNNSYIGWNDWSEFVFNIFGVLIDTKILSNAERVGLRYINFFEGYLNDKIKLSLTLNGKQLNENLPTSIKVDFTEGDRKTILQVNNGIQVIIDNIKKSGSTIDIDCLYYFAKPFDSFEDLTNIINCSHTIEKEYFFNYVLSDEFLDTLNPTY